MGGGLIDIGGLAKPATVLIERVSDAVGGIFKPWQIRRTAHAEADARIILARADVEANELQQRAIERLVHEEAQKQANIESITTKAFTDLSEDGKPEQLERDWLTFFFDRCRNTSDEQMQSLWAKILAGQSNRPGLFSKKSIELVSLLEKPDAELFTNFGQFCWVINGVLTAFIVDPHAPIYNSTNINFSTLTHLDSLGLIRFENFTGFKRKGFEKYVHAFYFGRATIMELPDGVSELKTGKVLLTQTGAELLSICGASHSKEFESYMHNIWGEQGIILSAPLVGERGI